MMHTGGQKTDDYMGFAYLLPALLVIVHIKGKRFTTGVFLDLILCIFELDVTYPDRPPVCGMVKKVFYQGGGGKACPQNKDAFHGLGFDH
jgi:hypothetical protein